MAVSISWLGSPQLIINGQQIALERRKAIALLAYLSLADAPVARDVLATLFWPHSERRQALTNLRRVLFVLNRTVPNLVEIDRRSAEFTPPPNTTIDVIQFEKQIAHASTLPLQQRVNELRAALTRYRGDFLDGLSLPDSYAFESWQIQKGTALRHLVIEAQRELVAALFQLQRKEDALQQGILWLAFDPQAEEPYRTLMYLHAASGQKHEAIAYYHRCLKMLESQFENNPEEATTLLYEAIIGHKSLPATGYLPIYNGRQQLARAVLPVRVELIDRARQLNQICEQFRNMQRRLVTLKGIGGVGKSALAIEVAYQLQADYRDGAYHIDCANKPANLPLRDRLLDALNIERVAQISAEEQLTSFLRDRHILLILDNFDHFIGQATYLSRLLQLGCSVDLLVTSRSRLGLREEWIVQVHGLACPIEIREEDHISSSVRLFLRQSLRLGHQASWNSDEMAAIEQICQHVEGLPRAIILAAEWAGGMSPLYVLEDLLEGDDFLNFLAGQGEHLFETSWQQLPPRFQKYLAQLSVFERDFDRHAARFVTGASLQQMARLAEHSLLQQSTDGNWRLHRIIKQFAARKLSQRPTDLMEAMARLEQHQAEQFNMPAQSHYAYKIP